MAWVYLVLSLAVIFYVATAAIVGHMRHKHNILAPACAGHPEFERAFRVQQNTMEQIVVFLPMDYFFAQLVSPCGPRSSASCGSPAASSTGRAI
jgi:glutathione S-transferase